MTQKLTGYLKKMSTKIDNPVAYHLDLGDVVFPLNAWIGKSIRFAYLGRIFCIQCGRQTRTSFQQGYCYPCMQRLAECGFCIIHPEKCQILSGKCPENDWAHQSCGQTHIVYLANSSGLKVGITRFSQIPTRWIDQGATQALPLFQVANRYQSGRIEVCLKRFVSDRTDWRKMLKGAPLALDLQKERELLLSQAKIDLEMIIAEFPAQDCQYLSDAAVVDLHYPMHTYPVQPKAISLDKDAVFSGILQGIKGQYLILDTGVMNIRKFSGYEVEALIG
jgi:hypothetical protein